MTDQLKRAISAAKTAQSNATTIGTASSSAGDQNFDMSESSYKTSHTAVRKARRFAMQGLYEWLVTDRRFDTTGKLGWKDNAPHDIAARTRATNAMHTVHIGYYHEMMRDIPQQIESLDALISQHLDREIDKLDTVEHAILLIGAYELQNRLEIPYKVVLDEAMKLNNHFGATDAHKLINAVLDRMAVELRDIEVQADTKANLRTSQKVTPKSAIQQADSNEKVDGTDTDIDSQPAVSTKPRISANKTNVKRNRPNKASTGTSAVKAEADKNTKASEGNVAAVVNDNVDHVVINDAVTKDDVDSTTTHNQSVDESITEDVVADNTISINTDTNNAEALTETGNSDLEDNLSDDRIVETIKPSVSPIIETASAEVDDVKVDDTKVEISEIDSPEIAINETNNTDLNNAELNSTDVDTTDAKNND